jgi:excisionase family DNA binding protein
MSSLITVKEAAKRLSLSESKVYRMTMDGELASVHIGRAVRVPEEAVANFGRSLPMVLPSTHLKGAR